MSKESIEAEIEHQIQWRVEELAFLGRTLNFLKDDMSRDIYRKVLLVMLYAHFEGYVLAVAQSYVAEINQMEIPCDSVIPVIAAASMHREFSAIETPRGKCDVFKQSLPPDSKLHRLARRSEFIAEFGNLFRKKVCLSEKLVDTESNLKPSVLRKILYQLGLDGTLIDPYESNLHNLLKRRNSVAHGDDDSFGIKSIDYDKLQNAVIDLMQLIADAVVDAVRTRAILKP